MKKQPQKTRCITYHHQDDNALYFLTETARKIINKAFTMQLSDKETQRYEKAFEVQKQLNFAAEKAVKQNRCISTSEILDMNAELNQISMLPGFDNKTFHLFVLRESLKGNSHIDFTWFNWDALSRIV